MCAEEKRPSRTPARTDSSREAAEELDRTGPDFTVSTVWPDRGVQRSACLPLQHQHRPNTAAAAAAASPSSTPISSSEDSSLLQITLSSSVPPHAAPPRPVRPALCVWTTAWSLSEKEVQPRCSSRWKRDLYSLIREYTYVLYRTQWQSQSVWCPGVKSDQHLLQSPPRVEFFI